MVNPAGLAIDYENRFLYVTDLGLDQILVYDVDNYNLIRTIGTPGTKHASAKPGDFAKPTGVAVDKDGNVYVADMLNARVEVFDADGNFVRTFGKRGDMPGRFAMPKGVAIDSDGHLWVTDSIQNRIQVYSQEGDLLMYIGTASGKLPGQFSGLQAIAIDTKQNRVLTTEVFPGRVQEFRYVTQAEAKAEFDRSVAEKAAARAAKAAGKSVSTPPEAKAPAIAEPDKK
jgi:sugar lactone lactonase YvrE